MSRTRFQKRTAKFRNRAKRAALFVTNGTARVRREFFGKARSGDEAALSLTFSGHAIPVEEDRPGESLKEAAAGEAWEREGFPTTGEA
jgi:hypothetical protein